jgi:epoxyqueuosine reductase QueG
VGAEALERRVAGLLDAAGLTLRGVLAPAGYDARVPSAWRCAALLPGARSVWVVGSGGRALWSAAEASGALRASPDPLDAHTERALGACVALLRSEGQAAVGAFAHQRRAGAYADFVALGQAAGLGAPSRLGLLVHPVYGPWLSLRALLVTTLETSPSAPGPEFDACRGCPAPCAAACHGAAVAPAGFEIQRCAATRLRDPRCASRCDARRACVLGREHAYAEAAEAHHMRSVPARALVETSGD